MKKKLLTGLVSGMLVIGMAGVASAISYSFDVDAKANSSSGGTGLATGVTLISGSAFSVSASPTDLWNAGPLPRWSNADGLIVNLLATGSDDSGQAAGTRIGEPFALWTQGGLSAPYGSLVGEINGAYALLGTSFNGNAWANGELKLYYWDSNNGDNTEKIRVTVNDGAAPVPEPATMFLLGTGLAGLAATRRKKKA